MITASLIAAATIAMATIAAAIEVKVMTASTVEKTP